jgi:uncharacterized membrane protein YuzA (DUF378 family)
MMEFLAGWKTRLWSAFLALCGFVAILDPNWIVEIVGKQNQGYVLIGIAAVTWILRQFTTTPAGEAEKLDG